MIDRHPNRKTPRDGPGTGGKSAPKDLPAPSKGWCYLLTAAHASDRRHIYIYIYGLFPKPAGQDYEFFNPIRLPEDLQKYQCRPQRNGWHGRTSPGLSGVCLGILTKQMSQTTPRICRDELLSPCFFLCFTGDC